VNNISPQEPSTVTHVLTLNEYETQRDLPGRGGDTDGDSKEATEVADSSDTVENAVPPPDPALPPVDDAEEREEAEDDDFDLGDVARERASTLRPTQARERKLTTEEVNVLVKTGEVLKKVEVRQRDGAKRQQHTD